MKRNKPSTKLDMEALQKDVEENPDLYQYERAEKFDVDQSTIFYALKRLGISNKKTLFHPKADEAFRLIFQLKLFRYEFVEKRPIVCLSGRKRVYCGFGIQSKRREMLCK